MQTGITEDYLRYTPRSRVVGEYIMNILFDPSKHEIILLKIIYSFVF